MPSSLVRRARGRVAFIASRPEDRAGDRAAAAEDWDRGGLVPGGATALDRARAPDPAGTDRPAYCHRSDARSVRTPYGRGANLEPAVTGYSRSRSWSRSVMARRRRT